MPFKLPKQHLVKSLTGKDFIRQPKKIRLKVDITKKAFLKQAFLGSLVGMAAGDFAKSLSKNIGSQAAKKILGGGDQNNLAEEYKEKMKIVSQTAPYHGSISAMKRDMVPYMEKKFPETSKQELERYLTDIFKVAPYIFVSPAVVESALKRVITYGGIDVSFAKELAAANQNIMKQYVLV